MDINLLVLAIGNTRLHAAAIVAGEMRHVRHLPANVPEDWAAMIGEIWRAELADTSEPAVVACSVVPSSNAALNKAVEDATGESIEWVGVDVDLPIVVTTDEPAKTGVDRVLITAAAYEQLGKACVVVDAGTAITINLCNNEGVLVGGAIAPGATAMFESMHARTAGLPLAAFEAAVTPFGRDTVDAMRHGVTHALRGLVQTMAERWAEQMGTWPEVIATGGDAPALFSDWEIVHAISPDLLMYGLGLAYTNHHIKHGA